ncbi:uncharacterized protein ARMOST_00103 [Armillaria ostoyae]|uniref:Uncharacterized protein n=1 Tax=Armillaria ostoyae TaxID=47428 RepID=A0A284QK69_ARMOS|nr:uncharacterized protein ARMOST_00103 [Armillaria ostoyae]
MPAPRRTCSLMRYTWRYSSKIWWRNVDQRRDGLWRSCSTDGASYSNKTWWRDVISDRTRTCILCHDRRYLYCTS